MECPQCASLDMHVIVYREREATTRHCVCPDCRFEMWDEYGPWRIQPAPLDALRVLRGIAEGDEYADLFPTAPSDAKRIEAVLRVNPDCTIRGTA